jgi:hypothetical protein
VNLLGDNMGDNIDTSTYKEKHGNFNWS